MFVHACAAGYPTAAAEQGGAAGKKARRGSTTSRGEKGFIEGWYAALLLHRNIDLLG
jgi:hypothetical protein